MSTPISTGSESRTEWFARRPAARRGARRAHAALQVVAALIVGGAFWHFGHRGLAAVPIGMAVLVGTLALALPKAYEAFQRLLEALVEGTGRLVTVVLLAPMFLVFFSLAHLYQRIGGLDPLGLKKADQPTFWKASDSGWRKRKYLWAMFCTETTDSRRPRSLLATAAFAGAFLVLVEVGLRLWGFGNNVLYVEDGLVGYYPAPNQLRRRYGGVVQINNFGMRRPDISVAKPPGTTRILLLGDSTLYGGSYLNNEELYARRLEVLLNAKHGPGKFEVLNVAANAWGPYHKVGYVQRFGTFDADIAMICMPLGDIMRIGAYGLEETPFMCSSRPPRLALEEIFFHLTWRYRAGMLDVGEVPGVVPLLDKSTNIDLGIAKYVELARLLKSKGARVVFAVLPSLPTAMTGVPGAKVEADLARLRGALQPEGVTVDFASKAFIGQGKRDELYHDHVHLHRKGHEVYSHHLLKLLEGVLNP